MDKDEVIKRLKEHLIAKKNQNGRLCKNDKHFCVHYVEDFLQVTRGQAIKILEDNIPTVMTL